jgi:septal ring factor EnvC (AmiA/AmiB activator)
MKKKEKLISSRLTEEDYTEIKESDYTIRQLLEIAVIELRKTNPKGLIVEKKEKEYKIQQKEDEIQENEDKTNKLKKELHDLKIELENINEKLENETEKNLSENSETIKKELAELDNLVQRNQLRRGNGFKVFDLPPKLFEKMAKRCDLPLPELKKTIQKEFE